MAWLRLQHWCSLGEGPWDSRNDPDKLLQQEAGPRKQSSAMSFEVGQYHTLATFSGFVVTVAPHHMAQELGLSLQQVAFL